MAIQRRTVRRRVKVCAATRPDLDAPSTVRCWDDNGAHTSKKFGLSSCYLKLFLTPPYDAKDFVALHASNVNNMVHDIGHSVVNHELYDFLDWIAETIRWIVRDSLKNVHVASMWNRPGISGVHMAKPGPVCVVRKQAGCVHPKHIVLGIPVRAEQASKPLWAHPKKDFAINQLIPLLGRKRGR